MSYCRLGDDSDVYCYGHVEGGFVVHVASSRLKKGYLYEFLPKIPKPLWNQNTEKPNPRELAEWKKLFDTFKKEYNEAFEEIPLVFAGTVFRVPSHKLFREKLVELKTIGYKVPDRVFERIDSEMKEESNPDNE